MYKQIKKIEDVLRSPSFVNDFMILNSRKIRNTIAFKDLKKLWATNEKDFSSIIIGNEILTANLKIYNLKAEVVYKHVEYFKYHIEFLERKNYLSIWKTIDEMKDKVFYHVFDIQKLIFIKEDIVSKMPKFFVNQYSFVCQNNEAEISLFNFITQNEIWQRDLSEYFNYHNNGKDISGQIKQVKKYNESIIVVSDGGIVSLSIHNGEIEWILKTYASTMEIVGHVGYVCTGLSLYKINLDNGEMSGYGWENNRLPDFEWSGKYFWPAGYEVVYNEGLLWYSVYISGHSFLLAINPHDGHYEWIHQVETTEKTDSPKFHENRMFLHDTGGVLHIYEKNK